MIFLLLNYFANANPNYEQGIKNMSEKKYDTASQFFEQCIQTEPENIDCHWEMGWAFWMLSNWEKVIKHWSVVEKLNPDKEGLKQYLAQAKDNQNLNELVQKIKKDAPTTFKSAVPEGTVVRIRAVGDMMIGTNFPEGYLPPNDGAEIFSNVSSYLKDADITFGNLEGPICSGNASSSKCKNSAPGRCYAFRSPPSYVNHYKNAGFDLLSTANNHANDFGQDCRLETERLLNEVGISHSGRPGDIASIKSNGLTIAMIAFHTSRSSHYLNDLEMAKKLVQSQVSTHDIVIVSFHGGAEGSKAIHVPMGKEVFLGEDRGNLRQFSRGVIDAGADIVIGHGPHVLRGMEMYNDRLIAYSLGNFATYGRFNISGNKGLGIILEGTFDSEGKFIQGKIISTKQTGKGVPIVDDSHLASDLVRRLSIEDFGETAIKVAQDGSIKP